MGAESLNRRMNGYPRPVDERMLTREVRIIDTQIMASLQNGTAFFASTSLIAVGGALTLLRSPTTSSACSRTCRSASRPRALWE